MEPRDHPPTPEGPRPIRGISLTSASARTAALGEQAESGFSDRARGFTLIVFLAALFFSAVWPAAILAFLVALLGVQGLLALGPEWWVMVAAGAIFPIPPIWIAVMTWARTRDLSVEARRLSHLADRLLEPDQTAAHEIATIGMAIRREVDSLSTGVETALSRVRSLEGAVAAQAMAIDDAAADAEARAEDVRSRMEQERKALADLTASLKQATETHSREIDARTRMVEDVTSKARTALNETTTKLEQQAGSLSHAAEAALSGSAKVTSRLTQQTDALNQVSDQALSASDSLAQRYDEHRARLVEAVERLNKENSQLEGVLGRQRELLGSVAELIASQNQHIDKTMGESFERLSAVLDQNLAKAREVAGGFREDLESLDGSGRALAQRIEMASAANRASVESASAFLDEELARIHSRIEQETREAREAIGVLFKTFENNTRGQGDMFREEISRAREAAMEALKSQSESGNALIREAGEELAKAGKDLTGLFDRLLQASHVSGSKFDETASRVDEHMRSLPGLAEETRDRIGAVLDDELNAFARLAEDAVRKIRALGEAYARHMPTAPRATQGREPGPASILGQARPLSQTGNLGSERKGEWAWGDILKAVDRPFEKANPPPHAAPAASSDDAAQAFSRSSLEVFEALQSMAVDLDRALESDPPRDLLRRYLNGERDSFVRRLKEISSEDTANRIHDKYLEDAEFRENVNQYIEQFEGLLNNALANDQEDILIETYMSSTTGKVYFLLGGAIGHFGEAS